MKPYSSKSNLSDKVSEFLGTLSWHLGGAVRHLCPAQNAGQEY